MAKKESRAHILTPKHKKLSDKEKAKLLDTYNITFKELPAIIKSDPAIADLEAEEGDVIMIDRASPTAGKTTFYRGVING
jgi:DNA-directed RNA polymerase subunit H (RpoH/RPB5)